MREAMYGRNTAGRGSACRTGIAGGERKPCTAGKDQGGTAARTDGGTGDCHLLLQPSVGDHDP